MTTVVYPLREDRWNLSLRYSLRSLVNLRPAVERVIVVGYKPSWLTGVEFIPGNCWTDKPRNVFGNILLTCQHPDTPESFILANDDFYVLHPWTPRLEHRRPLREHYERRKANDWYKQSLGATLDYLASIGYDDPMSFELHRPMPIKRDHMREALEKCQHLLPRPQARTVYGVTLGEPSTLVPDVKIMKRPLRDGWDQRPLASSGETFPQVLGDELKAMFPAPSPWEAN